MPKKVSILTVTIILTLAIVASAQAVAGSGFTGTVDDDSGCKAALGGSYPAHINDFTVPVSGTYRFEYSSRTWSSELYAEIMEGAYDPTQITLDQGFLGIFSSYFSTTKEVTLTAGTNYHLVVSNYEYFTSYAACMTGPVTDPGDYVINFTLVAESDTGETGDAGETAEVVLPPGPDMVHIPDSAVVGVFHAQTNLYYAPDMIAASPYTMQPGQTLWVLGVDETGGFYKVLLSGEYFWAPVSSMGANYDAVWNGFPLPTDVVE